MKKDISIDKEILLFASHLESLHTTLPFAMLLLQSAGKHFSSELQDFVNTNCEVKNEDHDKGMVFVKPEYWARYKEKSFKHKTFGLSTILVPRSFLVSMVSQYDAYLGRLLRALFFSKPEILNSFESKHTFFEVSKYESIDAFAEGVISKEVETVLRKSHAEQFSYLESKFGLKLRTDLGVWPDFIELTERRNLFVHADGIVSGIYIANCKEHNVPVTEVKEGDVLGVPHDYFQKSYKTLYEIGVKLGQVLWRKVLPHQAESADRNLISISFDLIERGENDLACRILSSALKYFEFHSDWNKYALIINCAQAHKWAEREEECREILEEHDWSAKGDDFKIANAVLCENWEEAIKIMRRIGSSGCVEDINYRDWPLFKEFRKKSEFLQAYLEIFKCEFQDNILVEKNVVSS